MWRGGGGVTRLDGLYPQAYDLISIFSIFMEVSNIWLKRTEYEKGFRPVTWGSFGIAIESKGLWTDARRPGIAAMDMFR